MTTAPAPLPGMPMRVGDPGVFVCGPADIAPWKRTAHPSNDVPRPPAPRRTGAVWLVLSTCPDCLPRWQRYCDQHGPRNWWLENFRPR